MFWISFRNSSSIIKYSLTAALLLSAVPVSAQTLPGPADIDRAAPPETDLYARPATPPPVAPASDAEIRFSKPPANAEQITFKLEDLTVEGVTAYTTDEIRALYQEQIGQTISLDQVWKISDKVTQKYRQDGYFLSRAYIPAQEIEDGKIVIRVVEGYIAQVEIDEDLKDYSVVQKLVADIISEKPVSAHTLERNHLLLTDVPGMQNLYGTLDVLPDSKDGGVRLVYSRNEMPTQSAFVGVDNFGSEFLGPVQAIAVWKGNLISIHETSLAVRTSLPLKELQTVNAVHTVPLTPALSVSLSGGYARAEPGFTLKPQEIESRSIDMGVALDYKIIRQRQENLSVSVGLNGRNSKSTILDTATLSDDKIRAARISGTYDKVDPTGGYNRITAAVSQGLEILGSSSEDDINLSRDDAKPDFTKLEAEYTRYQPMPHEIGAVLTVRGQKASGSLYSSEEFGFGGQGMGRAYDSSEISGDDGVGASIEVQYDGIPEGAGYTAQPYAFYDIGKVWNDNDGQVDSVSASSAGAGVRFQHLSGLTGTLQVSVPLTKRIDTPANGSGQKDPQIDFQLGYRF